MTIRNMKILHIVFVPDLIGVHVADDFDDKNLIGPRVSRRVSSRAKFETSLNRSIPLVLLYEGQFLT